MPTSAVASPSTEVPLTITSLTLPRAQVRGPKH